MATCDKQYKDTEIKCKLPAGHDQEKRDVGGVELPTEHESWVDDLNSPYRYKPTSRDERMKWRDE